MKKTPTHIQALYLSQQLQKGQEPVGGMLFYKAIVKAQLDFTPESLKRLDNLFATIREEGNTLPQILTHPQHKNFLLTIVVYIGDYIGRQLGEMPMWSTFKNFPQFVEDPEIEPQFPFSLISQYTSGVCVPFGAVMDALSDDFSIEDYIEGTADNTLSNNRVNAMQPANDICIQYLAKVRTGKLIDNTMAYSDLLKKVKFDFSYKSLQQIDKILAHIKDSEKLGKKKFLRKDPRNRFINDPARQAFIYMMGCYIGMTSAQLAKTAPKWFNNEEMQNMLNDPNFVFCLENNHVMMLNGGVLMLPLMAVTNYFFELNPESSMGAVDFAKSVKNYVDEDPLNLTSLPFSLTPTDTQASIPKAWQKACQLAGQLSAFNLVNAVDAGELMPKSLDYQGEGSSANIIAHSDGDVSDLLEQLDRPLVNAQFGFLTYDLYVNLPTGRTDGIAIEIRVHSEQSLNLQFILPYRHANNPFGFALYPLIHNQENADFSPDILQALAYEFYQGAIGIKDPNTGTDYWSSYYLDKHDLCAPPAWLSKDIETFNPEDSQIDILPVV